MAALREQVLRRKPVEEMAAETGADTGTSELKRTIGLWSLSAIGIGGTIGTGIFFILSQAVPMAGPAVVFSFLIAGLVAGLTAVCYAELAGAVPVAGSSYSYTYATLGRVRGHGRRRLPAARVGRGWRGRRGRLVGVPQPVHRQRLRCPDTRGGVERSRTGRHHQPARGDPDHHVRAAADPRRQRVGEDQRRHGRHQDLRSDHVHRHRRPGLELRQPGQLRPVRLRRHLGRGGRHLLQLRRPGQRRRRGRGSEEPEAKPSAGDHDRAGNSHGAVRV